MTAFEIGTERREEALSEEMDGSGEPSAVATIGRRATITLLTWNVNQWPVRGWSRRARQDLEAVRALIAPYDVVCLQECWSRAAQGLGRTFPYSYTGRERTLCGFGSGLLILSKHPIGEGTFRRFRTRSLPDSLAAKGMILARICVPEAGEIDVVNTHLQAWRRPEVRSRQLGELERFVGDFVRSPLAVVAGDLNVGCGSGGYRRLREILGLRDAIEECPVEVREGGAATTARSPAGVRFSGANSRIDHVLLREVPGATAKILTTGIVNTNPARTRYPSDHHGLFVRMELSREKGGGLIDVKR